MPTIYRVEHRERRVGPYWGGGIPTEHYAELQAHPAPWQEEPPFLVEGRHFGFVSREQYDAWFYEHTRPALKENGFVLAIYECEDDGVHVTKHQCVFVKDKARHIRDEELC